MSFDYVICGGGLSGLVLAARLSEDQNTSVCVLEAGRDVTKEADTQIPGFTFKNLVDPEATCVRRMQAVPQSGANNRAIHLPSGKALGGSTMINAMAVGRGNKEEYDAFEVLGADGWNWSSLLPYFKKSETFTVTEYQQSLLPNLSVDERYAGTSGPWQRTAQNWNSDIAGSFVKSLESLEVKYNQDSMSGDNAGVSYSYIGIDPKDVVRSSAASAYYEPNKGRSNLHVFTNAHVARITMRPDEDGKYIADGVEYLQDGTTHKVVARREVIVSAGSHQTPKILELSGIGDKTILEAFGVECVIDLPGVGKNLQDHFMCSYTAEVDPTRITRDVLFDPQVAAAEFQQYMTSKTGMLSVPSGANYWAFLPTEKFMDPADLALPIYGDDEPGLKLQTQWLTSQTVPQLQLFFIPSFMPSAGSDSCPEPGKRYVSCLIGIKHPFARGSVHISSSDPFDSPAIDLAVFKNDIDLQLLKHAIKFTRRVFAGEAFKGIIKEEVVPGPDIQTDSDIEEHIKKSVETIYHPIATASMVPRSAGGVVDNQLKVYGTKNLRVVDASVIPIHVSAPIQATVYAIAEKAADIIKHNV